jgi:hypothetical protein
MKKRRSIKQKRSIRVKKKKVPKKKTRRLRGGSLNVLNSFYDQSSEGNLLYAIKQGGTIKSVNKDVTNQPIDTSRFLL